MSSAYIAKHQPAVGGYVVFYPDGYQSFCPGAAFERDHAVVLASEVR